MVIKQGEVFWADLGPMLGSAPAGRRPVLVVQSDRFNRSEIRTTVVAALTTNLKLAAAPGNVRVARGEAGLPTASVVNVSQLRTIDKEALRDRIGKLSRDRLRGVLFGIGLLLEIDS